MRICMILNNFEPPFGGPELQAIAVTSRLREQGCRVILIAKGTGKAPRYERIDGMPVYRLNRKRCGSVDAWFQLKKLKDQFDVIHVHGVGRLASVAVSFARKHGKRVYVKVTTAGHIVKEIKPGFKGMLKSLSPFRAKKPAILKQADGVIAISEEILAELARHGFPREKIFYIPNGVDTEKFHPVTEAEKAVLRRKLGLPPEKTIFIFTGRLTRRKGMDVLLQAWQRAVKIQDKATLALVGSGAGQADDLETWARQYVQEHGLSDTVVFAGAQRNVNEYLSAADCFVFPSRREGLPNSLLEAMAANLVCLVSDIGGNTDIVIPGQTGVLIPAESIDDWARALEDAVFTPARALGENAGDFVKKKYGIDSTVEKLSELYAAGVCSAPVKFL